MTWSKEGTVIKITERITITRIKRVHILEIRKVTSSDAGSYRMSASNDLGESSTEFKVKVAGDSDEVKKKEALEETKYVQFIG